MLYYPEIYIPPDVNLTSTVVHSNRASTISLDLLTPRYPHTFRYVPSNSV